MDVNNLISAIVKKVFPDLAGAAILVVAVNWVLPAVAPVPVLTLIIQITITTFIVASLTVKICDEIVQVIDGHRWRESQRRRISAGDNPVRIVEANADPLRIASFAQSSYVQSSYLAPRPVSSKLKTMFLIIVILIVIAACIFDGMYFYFTGITNAKYAGIDATASAIAANPYPIYLQRNDFQQHMSLAIYDSLAQSSGSLWQTAPQCQFIKQAYHVQTSQENNTRACAGPSKQFKNFAYEIEMTILQGDCGGLLFRRQNTSSNYYFFRVCHDGTYALLKYVDDRSADAEVFYGVSETNRAIIKGIGQTNRIAVITKGSSFYLYIHNHQVAEIDDKSYSEGYIGLVAFSQNKADITKVTYQNVRLWEDTTT